MAAALVRLKIEDMSLDDMERIRSADLGAVGLRKAWMVLAVGEALSMVSLALLVLLGGVVGMLAVVCGLVALVGIVWYLVALWSTKTRYEALHVGK